MDNQPKQNSGLTGKTSRIMLVIALGSLCGLIEVVLGGLLAQAKFPYKSGLLAGLGFGIIAFAYAIYKKPLMAFWIGIVAVLCKQLVVPVLGLSVMCKMNSCLAVVLEYTALAGVAAITMKRMKTKGGYRLLTGGSGALIGSVAFLFIGMHVAPCEYLLGFNQAGGFVSFLYKESLSWVVFSSVLFPIGWVIGEKQANRLALLYQNKPRLAYAGVSAIAAICWAICAIAIAGGF
jgi:hypothetical protein